MWVCWGELRQRVQISCSRDGQQVLVRPISHRVLPTPCRQVDQGPQIGRPRELQGLCQVRAPTLAVGGKDRTGVGGHAVETQHLAQI